MSFGQSTFGQSAFGVITGTADLTMQPATCAAVGRQDVADDNVGTLSSSVVTGGTPSSPTSAGETWSYWKGDRRTVFTARGRSTLSPAVCAGVARRWPSPEDEARDEVELLALLEKFFNDDDNNQTGKDDRQ